MRWMMAVAITGLLAGCGNRTDLKPREGHAYPAKPIFAPTAPTTAQLLTPDTQSRPVRGDEQIDRSKERRDDKFDLPPPG